MELVRFERADVDLAVEHVDTLDQRARRKALLPFLKIGDDVVEWTYLAVAHHLAGRHRGRGQEDIGSIAALDAEGDDFVALESRRLLVGRKERLQQGSPGRGSKIEPAQGDGLCGKICAGVVGVGVVGRNYIAKAKALGAEVVVADPYLPDEAAAELGVERIDLPELMRSCPIVVIHAPSTPETHHMIGATELAVMPDNGYLVNTARSWVVDDGALLAELQSGRLRAALDVYDREPLPVDHPFRSLPNAILTPHVAGASTQSNRRQGLFAAEDLRRFFDNEPLANEVTPARYKVLA